MTSLPLVQLRPDDFINRVANGLNSRVEVDVAEKLLNRVAAQTASVFVDGTKNGVHPLPIEGPPGLRIVAVFRKDLFIGDASPSA
jgi:hypothetical protein